MSQLPSSDSVATSAGTSGLWSKASWLLARLALAAGLACALAALLAGPGYRTGVLGLGPSLQVVRWAATVAVVAALAALAALGAAWLVPARRVLVPAAAALLINVFVAAPPVYLYVQLLRLPKIHDISTDTADPPVFSAVLPLRQGAHNTLDYSAATAAAQKAGYPDIAPLHLDDMATRAFERAAAAARAMGWEIVSVDDQALRIEATDTTLLFGFKDDVVIRVRTQGPGSVVDVRSVSRVGGSDFGVNAGRVRTYLDRLGRR